VLQLAADLAAAQAQLAQEASMLKEVERSARDDAATLRQTFEKYDERDALEKQLTKLTDATRKNTVVREQQEAELAGLTRQWQQAQAAAEGVKQAELSLATLKNQQLEREHERDALTVQVENVRALHAAQERETRAKEAAATALEAYERQGKAYEAVRQAFIQGQAALLALELQPQVACPVCGSLEHPSPAQARGDVVNKEALEAAEATLATVRAAYTKAKEAWGIAQSKLEAAQAAVAGLDEAALAAQLTAAQEALDALVKQRGELEAELAQAKRQAQGLEGYERRVRECERAIEDAKAQLAEGEKAASSCRATLEAVAKELEYENAHLARAAHDTLVSQAEAASQRLQQLQEGVRTAEERERLNAATVERLRVRIEQLACVRDLAEVTQEEAALGREQRELGVKLDELKARHTTNTNALAQVDAQVKVGAKLAAREALLGNLSDVAAGNTKGVSGANRVSFERFVQARWLDRVLASANKRLAHMSEGRYELVRSVEGRNASKQGGLEIDVFDRYTGRSRSSDTLSGGEAFEASLALALGLSDVVQQRTGGLTLETMFIDEGFGSLDKEALTRAINTLMTLAGGNKLVGIISHVEELQQAIDQQIRVTRTQGNEGASLEVVV
jgi:exonuclease SbcC